MRIAHMTSSPDSPIYVVGDVHGMREMLDVLIKSIENHAEGLGATPRFLFLGDLTGNGPSSWAVMHQVSRLLIKYPGSQVILGSKDLNRAGFAGDPNS